MSDELANRHCVACDGDVPPLDAAGIARYSKELGGGWQVVDGHHLSKTFPFKNFVDALAFVNRIGEVAEREGHHPDLFLSWGKTRVEIFTHSAKGLTEADFVLAAKIDRL